MQDITEMKTFPQPPPAVRVVMEAVCTLLGEATDWENAKRVLGNPAFINLLQEYDKDNIPDRILKKIARCLLLLAAMKLLVRGLLLWQQRMRNGDWRCRKRGT